MAPAPWNPDPLPGQEKSNKENLFLSSGKTSFVTRNHPIVHNAVDAPICLECRALELTFFDPSCPGCRAEIQAEVDPNVGVAHVMAALRQWVPQVQQSVEFLVGQALQKGAHPDDRDSVTDMTLLMFTCKAGASGVGDGQAAARVTKHLLELGASLDTRCRWTDMTPLHYAAYFDVAPVLTTLLMESKGVDVDTPCAEYENGTALHIAAANLGVAAAKVLLGFGADPNLTDDLARKPVDCIPELSSLDSTLPTDEVHDMVEKLQILLVKGRLALADDQRAAGTATSSLNLSVTAAKASVSGRTVMHALGLKIGDRVLVNGNKLGTLHFCGTTAFAGGIWAGVELDLPEGKNDGSVQGTGYFGCAPEHGVFVAPNKVTKVGRHYRDPEEELVAGSKSTTISRPPMTKVNHGKVDVSRVGSRLTEAMTNIAAKGSTEIRVGDRVNVTDLGRKNDNQGKKSACHGTVRFVGSVDFVEGDNKWYGIELDEPLGRHDGTVEDVRYFAAPDDHGVFVTESKLVKIVGNSTNCTSDTSNAADDQDGQNTFSMNYHTLDKDDEEKSKSQNNHRPLRRSLSMQHRATKGSTSGTSTPSFGRPPSGSRLAHSPAPSSSLSSSYTAGVRQLVNPFESKPEDPGWQSVGTVQPNKFQMKRSPQKKYIDVGTTVICIHNKEMGVVKYVGRADFASGIWIGLELRNPRGKHDGFVNNRRYFSTKASHGIMIRPKMVSVHGINGNSLLKPESEYPF